MQIKSKSEKNGKILAEKELSFSERVKEVVRKIPKGQTLSYKEVAVLASCPQGARAVANVMAKNYDLTVPCHRVIRSDGKVGDYNRGGEAEKLKILLKEGWGSD